MKWKAEGEEGRGGQVVGRSGFLHHFLPVFARGFRGAISAEEAHRLMATAVRIVAHGLMGLLFLLAVLMIPLMFICRGMTFMYQCGETASNYAARSVWPMTALVQLAAAAFLYMTARALWYVGRGKPTPKLLLTTWTGLAAMFWGLLVGHSLVWRHIMCEYAVKGWGIEPEPQSWLNRSPLWGIVLHALLLLVVFAVIVRGHKLAHNERMEPDGSSV